MRSITLAAACLSIGLAAPSRAADPIPVKLKTLRGSMVSGSTEIESIRLRSDLGTLDIAASKIRSIQVLRVGGMIANEYNTNPYLGGMGGGGMGGGFRNMQIGGFGGAQGPNEPAAKPFHKILTTAGDTVVGVIESVEPTLGSDVGPLKINWIEVDSMIFRPEPPKAEAPKPASPPKVEPAPPEAAVVKS